MEMSLRYRKFNCKFASVSRQLLPEWWGSAGSIPAPLVGKLNYPGCHVKLFVPFTTI